MKGIVNEVELNQFSKDEFEIVKRTLERTT